MSYYTDNYGKIDNPVIIEQYGPAPYLGCPLPTRPCPIMAELLVDLLDGKWLICKVQTSIERYGAHMERSYNINYYMDNCGQVWKIYLEKNPNAWPSSHKIDQFQLITKKSDIPLTNRLIDLAKGSFQLFCGRRNHICHSQDTAIIPTKEQLEFFMKPAEDMWELWQVLEDDND